MSDNRLTREEFLDFEFCHGCVADEPFHQEAYTLLDERDAAVALLREWTDEHGSGCPNYEDMCMCTNAPNLPGGNCHSAYCLPERTDAFLASLDTPPSPAVR